MTDMGASPPSAGSTDDARRLEEAAPVGPPHSVGEEPSPTFDAKELPQHGDVHEEMARARRIMDEVANRHYGTVQESNAQEAAAMAKELATLVLARLAVPGDVKLHEAVFRLARQTVAERYELSEGEIGDMGILQGR